MPRIPPVETDRATPEQAELLRDMARMWQREWNVVLTLANSPNLLRAFRAFWNALQSSSLSRDDREVVDLEMARVNGCHYCVPAHVHLSRESGLPEDDIAAIAAGREPRDPRRRLVVRAARALHKSRGDLPDATFRQFMDEGLTVENLLDIIGEIAHCTLTNYVNRLAGTELDEFLEHSPPPGDPEGAPAPKTLRHPLRPPKVG